MSLRLRDVSVTFGALRAVDGIDLDLGPGEILGLVGPNGSGKSTLLNAISGLVPCAGGTIEFGDEDLTGEPPFVTARHGVSRTFQLLRLLNGMTVEENVAAGVLPNGPRLDGVAAIVGNALGFGRPHRPGIELAEASMERTGIAEYARALVETLPFGIQRRVELARAVASQPRLLILDEPAAGLDPKDLEDLSCLMREEADRGCAVILVDHHLQFVMDNCPRALVLNFGKKIYEGSTADLPDDPEVREAYVGN